MKLPTISQDVKCDNRKFSEVLWYEKDDVTFTGMFKYFDRFMRILLFSYIIINNADDAVV